MSWETIEKLNAGPSTDAMRATPWFTTPAVRIGLNGLSMNGPFLSAFVNGHKQCETMLDVEHGLLGIRPVDVSPNGFAIHRTKGGRSASLSSARIAKRLEKLRGKAFKAKFNKLDNLVEVDLSPANQLS